MHSQAFAFIAAHLPPGVGSVLEFGSRNINGSVRDLVPACDRYVGVDISDGDGVDVIADAGTVQVDGLFECVVCAEVFEHASNVECQAMCLNACRHLKDGGRFVATMAGPGRKAHSAFDGGPLRFEEFYRNVGSELLGLWLEAAGFGEWSIDEVGDDVRCVAYK